jgi:hypothetical protein
MAYLTGTSFAPISRPTNRNFKLVGYWLNASLADADGTTNEIKCRLDYHCTNLGSQLNAVEWDRGSSINPVRMGLWRALRRLVCDKCQPKRMAMSFLHLDDFMNQALAPCSCGSRKGLEGIIVTTLKHLSSDQAKLGQIVIRLAEAGKHVIADDGICLSCCHPSTKLILQKKRLLVAS